jgi:hypothetical protein
MTLLFALPSILNPMLICTMILTAVLGFHAQNYEKFQRRLNLLKTVPPSEGNSLHRSAYFAFPCRQMITKLTAHGFSGCLSKLNAMRKYLA